MKKSKYLIFTIVLFLVCITNTYAVCTNEEILEFKKVEDEYKITYEFNKETKDYSVTFHYRTLDKYGYRMDPKISIIKTSDSTETSFTISNVKNGEYKFEILGVSKECDNVLKTIELSLPKYNPYSENELCKGIEEFVLCKPTYNKELDYETFVSRVNTYKKSKQNNPEEKEEIVEDNLLIEYIKENKIQILVVLIFLILLIITIIITAKSIRKSRRLE